MDGWSNILLCICVCLGIVKLTNKLNQAFFSQGDQESLEVRLINRNG